MLFSLHVFNSTNTQKSIKITKKKLLLQ